MARHLKSVTDAEWADLRKRLVAWLTRHKVAGSIAAEYSLYTALDEEREKARRNPRDLEREALRQLGLSEAAIADLQGWPRGS